LPQPPSLAPDHLEALARKYRRLVELRTRRDGGGPAATRAELRGLATQFPGALRELDTLGAAELARRAAACDAALAGGPRHPQEPQEPWMVWIDLFHALMRRALDARARGGPAADDFERAVLDPPRGRMLPVVVQRVAALCGALPEEVAATLFPSRRQPA
jgi:hypothetical protein